MVAYKSRPKNSKFANTKIPKLTIVHLVARFNCEYIFISKRKAAFNEMPRAVKYDVLNKIYHNINITENGIKYYNIAKCVPNKQKTLRELHRRDSLYLELS